MSNTFADFVRNSRNYKVNKMQSFDIDGAVVKTNFGAVEYPKLSGNENGYRCVPFGESESSVFNDLVAKGYTYIRFAEMTTAVRGYHKVYYKAKMA